MAIARDLIDPDAEKVLRRLHRHQHKAYLVGGCVRDLLLGRTPKDFDIATSATPNEIKDLFRNCRIIGRRFRLAHIFFGSKIIETSTFRSNPREGSPLEEGEEILIRRDNVFGTTEEDARRRDFTINGLFYDLEAGEVLDYVGGLADLDARLVRTIGDPEIRFREDPVRILRAIKFAARLGFEVEPVTYAALLRHRGEIHQCAPPRVLEEIYRLLRGGAARRSMEILLETGVASTLAPELAWSFGGAAAVTASAPPPDVTATPAPVEDEQTKARRELAWRLLGELDTLSRTPREELSRGRVQGEQPGSPTNALVFSILVAPFVPEGEPGPDGRPRENPMLVEDTMRPLAERLRVSRRDAERGRQILLAQKRLAPSKRRRARPMALVKRDYFGEALVLYEIMARAAGEVGDEVAKWRQLWRRNDTEGPGAFDDGSDADDPGADRTPELPMAITGAPPGGTGSGGAGGGGATDEPKRRRRRRGGRRRKRGGAEGALPGSGGADTIAPLTTGGTDTDTQ